MKRAIGRTAALATVLMFLLACPVAWADQDHHFLLHLIEHVIEHAKEIGLSADQLVSVKALQLDFDLTRIKVDADIMLTEREIAATFGDDQAELSAVEAKIHQSEAIKAALRVASFKALRKALALLTPEQREKSRRISAHPSVASASRFPVGCP